MKRYETCNPTDGTKSNALFKEYPEGDWCKWSDVEALLADVEIYKMAYQKEHAVCTKWLNDNFRYKSALEKIAELPHLSAPLSWGIARAALEEK